MTLIDGCVLVGATDKRLKVKRTPGMPIMNGEERNILSPFSYPLSITDAASENRIEHSVESNQKPNTPSTTANEANDLKNILLNEDCRSCSEITNAEAKVLSKSDGKLEDSESNKKKLVIISECVNSRLSDRKLLSEEISPRIDSDENHISSISENSPNGDKSESIDVPLVNKCIKKTNDTSCVNTSRINGTSVFPTSEVGSSCSKSDPSPRLNSSTELSNVKSEDKDNSEAEQGDPAYVLSASVDMKTDFNNHRDSTANCNASIETKSTTQSNEVTACTTGANSSDNKFSDKLPDIPCIKPNDQVVDGSSVDLSFESESEEMILQMEEDELLETDFQSKYDSERESEEKSSEDSEKTSICKIKDPPKPENLPQSSTICSEVVTVPPVVVPELIIETGNVPPTVIEKLSCVHLDSSNTLKEQCLKESSNLESKQVDNSSISSNCTVVEDLMSDIITQTSDLLDKFVTIKSSENVTEIKEEHTKKLVSSEEQHSSVSEKKETSQLSTSNNKSYCVPNVENKDERIVESSNTRSSPFIEINTDTQSLINTEKEECDVGVSVSSSNEQPKKISRNLPQKPNSSEESCDSEKMVSVENGALNADGDEMSVEFTSKESSSCLAKDDQIIQEETVPDALNEVVSSAKDNDTASNQNTDDVTSSLERLDTTVTIDNSVTDENLPESIGESSFSSMDAALKITLPEKNSNVCSSAVSLDASKNNEEQCMTDLQSLRNGLVLENEDSKDKLDAKVKCSAIDNKVEIAESFANKETKVDQFQDHTRDNESRSCSDQEKSTNLPSSDKSIVIQEMKTGVVLEDSGETNDSEELAENDTKVNEDDKKGQVEVQNVNQEATDSEDKKLAQSKIEKEITVDVDKNEADLKKDEKIKNENQEATCSKDKKLDQSNSGKGITINETILKQDEKWTAKAGSDINNELNVLPNKDTGIEARSENFENMGCDRVKLASCEEKQANESGVTSEVDVNQDKARNDRSQSNEDNRVKSNEHCDDKSVEQKATKTKETHELSVSPSMKNSESVDDVEACAEDEKEREQSFEDLCSEELILDDCSMESGPVRSYSEEKDSYPGCYIAPDSSDTSESEDEDYSSYENLNDEETTSSDFPDEGEEGCESLQENLSENSQDSFLEKVSKKIKDTMNELENSSSRDNIKNENQYNDMKEHGDFVQKNETLEKEGDGLISVNESLVKTSKTYDPDNKIFNDESASIEDITTEVLDNVINLVTNDLKDDSSSEKQVEKKEEKSESVPNFSTKKISHVDHLYSAAPRSSSPKKPDFSSSKRPASDDSDEDYSTSKRAREEEDEDIPSLSKRKLSGDSSSYVKSHKKLKINDVSDDDGDMSDSSEESSKVADDSQSSSNFNRLVPPSKTDDEEEVRKFQRFHRFSLQKFTRKDLEEIILLKMVEVLKYRGIAGEQQKQLTSLQEQCATQKKMLASIKKQYSESVIIMKKFIEQSESQQKKNVVPMKATRSVGLQVMLVDPQSPHAKAESTSKEIKKLPPSSSNTKPNKNPPSKLKSAVSPVASLSNQLNSPVRKVGKVLVSASPPKPGLSTLKVLTPVSRTTVVSQPMAQARPVTQSPQQIITALPQKPIAITTKASNLEVIDLVDDSQQHGRSVGIQGVPTKGLTVAQTPAGQTQISYVVTSGTQGPIYISPTTSQGTRMISAPINNRGVLSSPLKNGQFIQLQNKSGVLPGSQFHIVAANSSQLKQVIRPVINLNSPQKTSQFKHVPRILRPVHPAPLPTIQSQLTDQSWKLRPPKPTLRIGKNGTGITLSWTLNGYDKEKYAEIVSYQLFAYQEGVEPPSTDLWKKVGDVKALPLPMACTLTKFVSGHRYHFAVQAVDIHSRVGEYSMPENILLN